VSVGEGESCGEPVPVAVADHQAAEERRSKRGKGKGARTGKGRDVVDADIAEIE
jgi:hypothetical protein